MFREVKSEASNDSKQPWLFPHMLMSVSLQQRWLIDRKDSNPAEHADMCSRC